MIVYRNSRNESVRLSGELGGGGEGKVYAVSGEPGQVAKVWTSPNSNAVAKIEIMLRNRPPVPNAAGSLLAKPHVPFAWPEDALYGPDGKIVGYLMPRIDLSSFREIFRYYVPKERQELEQARGAEYRDRDFLLMARNLAEAVHCVHQAEYVIGDINEKNVLANDKAQVVIIDCDSMQVENPHTKETYLCSVGRPDYTPPGLTLGAKRTENHDRFGLAVLVFKLLMQGEHPYKISSTKTETRDKIRLGEFPYRDNKRRITDAMRRYQDNWKKMEPNLRRCFRDAFAPDYNSRRPKAAEWVDELDYVINPSTGRHSLSTERRLQESGRQLMVVQQERDDAKQQLDNERVARNQAGQALQEIQQQLEDEKRGHAEAEQRFQEAGERLKAEQEGHINTRQQLENEKQVREKLDHQLAAEQLARSQVSQPRSSQGIEKAAKVTMIVASYVAPPVITALLFVLFY